MSNNNCEETSYIVSIKTCQVLGTKKKLVSLKKFKLELKEITNNIKISNTKKFTNTKLVIEKSKQNDWIENNKIIWNCFKKRVYNIFFLIIWIFMKNI